MHIVIMIIIGLVVLAYAKEILGFVLGIGIIIGGGYLIFTNLGLVFKILIGLVILAVVFNAYENTIGKRKKLQLREKILQTINRMTMADAKQIAAALLEEEGKVEEELKVLATLGEVEAITLTEGIKSGSITYKSINVGNNRNTNFDSCEIQLD